MTHAPGGRRTRRLGSPARAGLMIVLAVLCGAARSEARPNVVIIYADDLGYGDVGAYGARQIKTPHIDALARAGRRFTDAYAPAATCTPSRYTLLTGEYAFRKEGTGILAGDASAIIQPGRTTLASILKRAGYSTAVVGKWHLGLGAGRVDWNGEVKPGPLEIGFDRSFILPATGDRVPTVYLDGHRVVGQDPKDPIRVQYGAPIGQEPTGVTRPDLLKVQPSHGHNQAIVNGISRIGYMTGGEKARWVDEDLADVITRQAVAFIEANREAPFFLFFNPHDIHVPRAPHARFAGKTSCGVRCDVIAQLDWSVGEISNALSRTGLARDTIVIFTSDNGPVVDDGYKDGAVKALGRHRPGGPLRGGKYSAFEAGTRVPFVVRWPARVRPGVSRALVSHVDLSATLAALVDQPLATEDAPDSLDASAALFGADRRGRDHLVQQSGVLALRQGRWKFIEPGPGPSVSVNTSIETGRAPSAQLYDLVKDPGETRDLAAKQPARVAAMQAELVRIRTSGRTRP